MKIKKILALMVIGTMLVTMGGCNAITIDGEENVREGSSGNVIGFSVSTLNNPFFVTLTEGAKIPSPQGRPSRSPAGGDKPRPYTGAGYAPPSGPPHEPSEAVRVGKRSRSGRSELCRWRRSEGSGACGDAVTLRVGRMAGSLSGHSAKNAAGLRPACFFASMSS